jgi:hypothetical protein
MRIKTYMFAVLALALLAALCVAEGRDDNAAEREYQIKAAFIYNFIKFVDWPKEKIADSNEPVIIGIIGKDPFGDAFEPLQEKEKKVLIQRFQGLAELEKSGEKKEDQPHPKQDAISKCHLLFVCPSESKRLADIVKAVKNSSILTVADTQGFLEVGGIINFVMEEKKIRFEISVTAAEKAGLKIRSQLLRLAKRVIKEDESRKNEDQ